MVEFLNLPYWIIVLLIIFWLWVLIDCLRLKLDTTEKVSWIIIIIFSNLLGVLLYLIFPKIKGEKHYLKNSYKLFINSFKKINIKIFFIMFFDLVFYAMATLISITTFNLIKKKALAVDMPQNILQLGAENIEKTMLDLRAFLFLLIGMIILMFLIIIIDWSIFKGLSWGITLKRKFNFKFFLKFFLLNLVWWGVFIFLLIAVSNVFRQSVIPIYIIVLTLIWIYFTNIIYTLFVKEEKFKSVKKAFKIGFTKIHYFILPYTVLILILSIIISIMNLITFLPYGAGLPIMALILLFYIAWARFYIVGVIESL